MSIGDRSAELAKLTGFVDAQLKEVESGVSPVDEALTALNNSVDALLEQSIGVPPDASSKVGDSALRGAITEQTPGKIVIDGLPPRPQFRPPWMNEPLPDPNLAGRTHETDDDLRQDQRVRDAAIAYLEANPAAGLNTMKRAIFGATRIDTRSYEVLRATHLDILRKRQDD